jgi:hypothetical protein
MNQQELVDHALEQVQIDLEIGDLTALEELFQRIPVELLRGYISESIFDWEV